VNPRCPAWRCESAYTQGDLYFNLFLPMTEFKIIKHTSIYGRHNKANKYLELADVFIEDHQEIIYWTEANDSRKGVFYKYKDGIYSQCSPFEIEKLLRDYIPKKKGVILPKALSYTKIQELIKIIKSIRFFYSDIFNPEDIINFKNGFLKVSTGELIPHSMNIVSTIQLPYEYDKYAECPLFMRVLQESLSNDAEKIMILQEFIGYCLTKSTKYELALFIVGEASTGKSTVLETVRYILGEKNCSSIRMDMLADSRFTGRLLDKYANIDTEIPQDIENYEDALKKIISGESITINTKFIPVYEAKPSCKLIFAANDLPRISDTSKAVFRRILLLDFNNVVDETRIDVDLKFKLRSECAGILNWAFQGLQRLNKNGKFTSSKDMVKRIDELRLLNNSIYYFVSEKYDVTENDENYVIINDMYEDYKNFCHEVGAKGIFKKIVFGKEMKKIYVNKIKDGRRTIGGKQIRIYSGIRKKDDVSQYTPDELAQGITWED